MPDTYIYALRDPGTLVTRYIGKANAPDKRLEEHWKKSSNLKSHLGCWLKSLSRKPILTVIETVKVEDWQARERYWIARFRECGYPLVNEDNGGLGGPRWTSEMRAKMSAHYRSLWRDPTYRAKTSVALKGVSKSAEHRRKISAALSVVGKGEGNGRAKLTEDDVREIRFLRDGGATISALALLYGVHPSTIGDIIKGRHWKHVVSQKVTTGSTCEAAPKEA